MENVLVQKCMHWPPLLFRHLARAKVCTLQLKRVESLLLQSVRCVRVAIDRSWAVQGDVGLLLASEQRRACHTPVCVRARERE
jgi:hypothetical protein